MKKGGFDIKRVLKAGDEEEEMSGRLYLAHTLLLASLFTREGRQSLRGLNLQICDHIRRSGDQEETRM